MTAAQHAMAEGDYALAAQRLVYARDAEPRQHVAVLRLMTLAFWQAGDLTAAGRARSATGPASSPTARRRTASPPASTRTWARSTSPPRRPIAPRRARPTDADAWERVGRLRLRLMDRAAAINALERARALGPSVEALLDLALAYHLAGDLGGEVTACEQAIRLEPDVASRLVAPCARARPHRPLQRAIAAASARSRSGHDAEVADLLERLRDAGPRVLPAA